MLGQLIKLFKLLNAEISSSQIAAGIALGMIPGLTPLPSLHNIVVLLFICLFRVNVTGVLMGWALFSGFAFLLDNTMSDFGEFLLLKPELKDFWTACYQSELLRLAHFNNTLTLGSLLFSLILFLPMFFILKISIDQYRNQLKTRLDKLPLVQTIKATKVIRLISGLAGAAEVKP